MQSRFALLLRIATVIVVVGIAVVLGFLLKFVLSPDTVPKTELERAVVAAEEAVKADPENSDARIKLAAAYLESGALSSAEKQADIALRLAPDDPAAFYIVGLVAYKNENYSKAITNLSKAANTEGELAAFYQDAWAALADAYDADGQYQKALDAMDKSINEGPENAQYLVRRAQLYESHKKWADALYDFAVAKTYAPDFQEAVDGFNRISEAHPEAVQEAKERWQDDFPTSDSTEETEAAPGEE